MIFEKVEDRIKEYIINNDCIEENLHVIAVVSNPCNYNIRYKLAKEFIDRIEKEKNIICYLVELVYGEQEFVLTQSTNKRHLQLRGDIPLWHKENMINLGVKYLLPPDWKAFAWIDADIEFDNPHWASDALKILNNGCDFIQLFTHAIDMDYNKQIMNLFTGFGYQYSKTFKKGSEKNYWHPGFAWACNRHTYDKLGGIFELSILGSGDNIMCHTFIKRSVNSLKPGMTNDYIDSVSLYQEKMNGIKLGYVPGTILHHFHGKKVNRKYLEREDILIKHQFSPYKHMTYDDKGLIIPSKDCPQEFLNDILDYFKNRNEDEMVEEEIKLALNETPNTSNMLVSNSLPKKEDKIADKKEDKKETELNNILQIKSSNISTLEYKINYIIEYFEKKYKK